MTPFATVMVLVSLTVVVIAALDLFFGGKGIAAVDRILSKRIETDEAIVKGLSAIRSGVEREVFNTDKAISSRGLQRLIAVLMILAAAFLAYTIFFRNIQ